MTPKISMAEYVKVADEMVSRTILMETNIEENNVRFETRHVLFCVKFIYLLM